MKNELPEGWPKDKPMAVSVNIPFEWWVEGDSPGVSPMGNPLKPGYKDTAALQWAEYALKHGLYRMLNIAENLDVKVTSSVSAIITESHPEALKRLDSGGHEIQAHAWAQGELAVYMSREEEDANIKRCMEAFDKCLGYIPKGYGIPRGTISENSAELLAANGFKYYNDDMSAEMPYVEETPAGPIAVVPYDMEVNDLPFAMRYGNPFPEFTKLVEDVITGYPDIGSPPAVLDITFLAQVAGRVVGLIQFQRILKMLKKTPWIWLTTRGEIAKLVLPY